MKPQENQEEVVAHRFVLDEVYLNHTRSIDFEEGDLQNRIDKFNAFVKKTIPISSLNLEEFNLDDDKVEEYLQMYKEKGSYPLIVFDEIDGSIIDGLHRANALAKAGLTEIEAYVGTEAHLDPHWYPGGLDDEDDEYCEDDDEPAMSRPRP